MLYLYPYRYNLNNGKFSGKISLPAFSEFLFHVGETFDGFCKAGNRRIRIAMLDSFADAMPDVPFEYDLSAGMQRGFCGVDLGENVLAGLVFVDHAVNRLNLAQDFF